MDINLQTKVNHDNRKQFYQQMYPHQFDSKSTLVNLDKFNNDCVLIDCCGWHYRDLFANKKIISLETVKSALQFKFDRSKFDKLIDDQKDTYIGWPGLSVKNPVLIFDRSPILKYRSIDNLINLLTSAVEKYNASELVVNLNLIFVDDHRLQDRFYNLASISIRNFTVREFVYNIETNRLLIHFKKNHAA